MFCEFVCTLNLPISDWLLVALTFDWWATEFCLFPVAKGCLYRGPEHQNISCLVHWVAVGGGGRSVWRLKRKSQLWHLFKRTTTRNGQRLCTWLTENAVPSTWQLGFRAKVHLANVYSMTGFPFVSCKYSFMPCQDLRSQKHEEAINISMEKSLWNLEFGIIFASQAQKAAQASLLIDCL